ncbi:MAG: alpha-N-arabinofuranosidase [Bacteroidales bacterium]|nr:alpha-N-arabinofuranosidase [Bacteroidales bacterium]
MAQTATITLEPSEESPIISRHIYGHFSEHLGHCIYDGLWVGPDSDIPNVGGVRKDVMEALKQIRIPNLRWPGGCFADEYHWMDGIGEKRAKMVNTNWGYATEDNSFGTHEFLDMCEELGAEPYVCGNVGSGTVEEMSKWVEYMNSPNESPMTELRKQNGRPDPWRVTFFAVGNESWGCGGNFMVEDYVTAYRRYQTFCRNYNGGYLKKVASGPAYPEDYHWTETVMRCIPADMMWGLSLHYYTVPGTWEHKGSATDFSRDEFFSTIAKALDIERAIEKHDSLMTIFDPQKKVALVVDEWGTWFDVEPGTNPGFLHQQNTMRDALVAALSLNIFNNHADRVRMANIAQLVNVLQSVILTQDDKMVLTPTYHIFDMYKVHQDARLVPSKVSGPTFSNGQWTLPQVNASASIDGEGKIHLTVANLSPDSGVEVRCPVDASSVTMARLLTAKQVAAHNTFDNPDNVCPVDLRSISLKKGVLTFKLPANSVVMVELVK